MPADIDDDGMQDLVAHSNNQVVWYKSTGNYTFIKCVIGPAAIAGNFAPCVYASDVDGDGDVDVLAATAGVGVGWYENNNLSWTWHVIDDSRGYHRVYAMDADLNGHMDVVALDVSISYMAGDPYLFRNDGMQEFNKELIIDLPGGGWRSYPVDFNNDGYLDIYISGIYVLLNNGDGTFRKTYDHQFAGIDGLWPSDINMDGEMDLVWGQQWDGTYTKGFYALLNDSAGEKFHSTLLVRDPYSGSLMDGGIALDIDLDGLPDIAGDLDRVGWFRQDPANPLTFSYYNVDAGVSNSHYINAAPLGRMCLPSIDLLVTDDAAHIVYENQMLLAFANLGWLESSVLEIARNCSLRYFGYKACVPYDTALAFYWRDGMNLLDVLGKPWSGPEYGSIGMVATDSFAVGPSNACMFQYKVEFRKGPDDIGVLYEIWLNYDCPSSGVEETCEELTGKSVVRYVDGNLVLSLPYDQAVYLTVYNAAGRQVKDVFRGGLSKGNHSFAMPAKPGIYFARIESHAKKESFKFTVFK
jgi:hypothetical protein